MSAGFSVAVPTRLPRRQPFSLIFMNFNPHKAYEPCCPWIMVFGERNPSILFAWHNRSTARKRYVGIPTQ
jgi:hypothetical protein